MHILELPEVTIRNIFDYLEDNEIYFVMRKVCRTFKMCSDGYLQIHSKFMLLEGNVVDYPWGSGSAWILYFTKRKGVTGVKESYHRIELNTFQLCHNCNKRYVKGTKYNNQVQIFGTVHNGLITAGCCMQRDMDSHGSTVDELNFVCFAYNTQNKECIGHPSKNKEASCHQCDYIHYQ